MGRYNVQISIITVVLNGREYIDKTIQSVIEQDYRHIEYIIIDGGSTDGTIDIIKRYRAGISCWVSEKDAGIADAMNKGILHASGQYILFLHSDDYLLSNSSIRTAKNQLQKNADFHAFPIYYDMGSHRIVRRSRGFSPWINLKTGFYHQGLFFHRDIFKRLGMYDTSFKIAMDYEFFLRAYRANTVLCLHRNPPLAVMRDTGISSRSDWNSLKTRFDEEKKAHFKHANSRFMNFFYHNYWLLYSNYRRLRNNLS